MTIPFENAVGAPTAGNESVPGTDHRTDGGPETPTPPRVEATPSEPTTGSKNTTVAATLGLTVGDPAQIRNSGGTVGNISGPVSGSLNWTGGADAAVLVVQVWVPDAGWETVDRVTVVGESPVSLDAVLGQTIYATGSRADVFNNPRDGTTRRTTGYLSVTAILFDDGAELNRTTATAEFTTTVTNRDSRSTPVDLVVGGTARSTVFEMADSSAFAAPGSSGVTRISLTNNGDRSGTIRLSSVRYKSNENGLTGPEADVDETGGDPGIGAGELHEALEIRASLAFADGRSRYVIGGESAYRKIASLSNGAVAFGGLAGGESVELVVEFRIPTSVGNEIQTDTLVVDFEFQLVESD